MRSGRLVERATIEAESARSGLGRVSKALLTVSRDREGRGNYVGVLEINRSHEGAARALEIYRAERFLSCVGCSSVAKDLAVEPKRSQRLLFWICDLDEGGAGRQEAASRDTPRSWSWINRTRRPKDA